MNQWFGGELSNLVCTDSFSLQVLIMLNWLPSVVEMPVGWSMILLESSVLSIKRGGRLHVVSEVQVTEDSMSWHNVVVPGWLIVPGMSKLSSVFLTHEQWE